MAFAYSTITGAVGATDTTIVLTVGTGVTASIFQAATNPAVGAQTYILVEQEMMQVISGTFGSGLSPTNVKRGVLGTRAMPHATLTPFVFGTSVDWLNWVPAIKAFVPVLPDAVGLGASAPVASAASIVATGPLFHVTGTTNITNMQPPTSALLNQSGPNSEENYVQGFKVTIIFDSTAHVASGGGGTGPAFASTTAANVAATASDFILDTSSGSALWYPFRNSA
jgi:hypothetical protein